jgi:exodeoxyribonuclease-3
MRLRIATRNVNSVRLRAEQVARYVREQAPDVLCLQEIKCQADQFPVDAFVEMGLPHLRISGQKGWHGVAIASRLPIEEARPIEACRNGHARCVSGTVAGVEIQNFYIPAGGDTPDREANEKFDHKLDFYEKLTAETARRDPKAPLVVAGDLNVAPGEHDVWNHRYMSKIVSHTPVEVEAFDRLIKSINLIDIVRMAAPEPAKLASWWSYRAQDFRKSNRGLRLDHLLLSPGLREAAFRLGAPAARIHDDVREWERPSDHAPVSVDLGL